MGDIEERIITLERLIYPASRRITQAGDRAGRALQNLSLARQATAYDSGNSAFAVALFRTGLTDYGLFPPRGVRTNFTVEAIDSYGRVAGSAVYDPSSERYYIHPVPSGTYTLRAVPPNGRSAEATTMASCSDFTTTFLNMFIDPASGYHYLSWVCEDPVLDTLQVTDSVFGTNSAIWDSTPRPEFHSFYGWSYRTEISWAAYSACPAATPWISYLLSDSSNPDVIAYSYDGSVGGAGDYCPLNGGSPADYTATNRAPQWTLVSAQGPPLAPLSVLYSVDTSSGTPGKSLYRGATGVTIEFTE